MTVPSVSGIPDLKTSSSAQNLAESASLIAKWALLLRGEAKVRDVLEGVQEYFDASSAMIIRYDFRTSAWRKIALSRDPEAVSSGHRSILSMAVNILGTYVESAIPGKVWLLSDLEMDSNELEFETARFNLDQAGSSDAAVVTLGINSDGYDLLELHFNKCPGERQLVNLMSLAETISSIWQDRAPGTAERLRAGTAWRTQKQIEPRPIEEILHFSNPYELSRCEYRLCVLAAQGLNAGAIAQELGLKLTTVRSHLTSIYAKTRTSGQLELMHRLLSSGQGAELIPNATNVA